MINTIGFFNMELEECGQAVEQNVPGAEVRLEHLSFAISSMKLLDEAEEDLPAKIDNFQNDVYTQGRNDMLKEIIPIVANRSSIYKIALKICAVKQKHIDELEENLRENAQYILSMGQKNVELEEKLKNESLIKRFLHWIFD